VLLILNDCSHSKHDFFKECWSQRSKLSDKPLMVDPAQLEGINR